VAELKTDDPFWVGVGPVTDRVIVVGLQRIRRQRVSRSRQMVERVLCGVRGAVIFCLRVLVANPTIHLSKQTIVAVHSSEDCQNIQARPKADGTPTPTKIDSGNSCARRTFGSYLPKLPEVIA